MVRSSTKHQGFDSQSELWWKLLSGNDMKQLGSHYFAIWLFGWQEIMLDQKKMIKELDT